MDRTDHLVQHSNLQKNIHVGFHQSWHELLAFLDFALFFSQAVQQTQANSVALSALLCFEKQHRALSIS